MSSEIDPAESWAVRAEKAAQIARLAQVADEFTAEIPKKGDRVDHFSFGLCEVLQVQGKSLKVRPVRGGKLRGIRLEALRVATPTVQRGRRTFGLRRGSD